jgi:hypothetical protein
VLNFFRIIINVIFQFFGFSLERISRETNVQYFLEQMRPNSVGIKLKRFGNKSDGGYILPDSFKGIESLVSIGCNAEWSFEKAIFDDYKIPSLIVDTLDKKPSDFAPPHVYVDKWIGPTSHSSVISLKELMDEMKQWFVGDSILKMDIEGSEYLSLISLPEEYLVKFRIIVIELHYLEFLKQPRLLVELYLPFIGHLLKNHTVVNLSPNTACDLVSLRRTRWPRVLELTLLRNDFVEKCEPIYSFEYKLNSDNIPGVRMFEAGNTFWFSKNSTIS